MSKGITYRKAGVDIDAADRLIDEYKKKISATRVKGSMDPVGGFGAFFDTSKYGIKDPLLVACADGVGTKLKIAIDTGKNDTVGIDLVAMNVNDCICCGARPVFFLDYFASGKLKGKVWKDVLSGIINGCRSAGCALLGGETAEMPGMYKKGDYDLAGFVVGIVDRKKAVTGGTIKPGDAIVGIGSSGLHSNGFSLVRKLFSRRYIRGHSDVFLAPTHIYVKPVMELLKKLNVKGIANITGGGFYDNIPRIFPRGVGGIIRKNSWSVPNIFKLIAKKSGAGERELYRTFNMGIGMVLVLEKKDAAKASAILKKHGLKSWVIGRTVKGRREITLV